MRGPRTMSWVRNLLISIGAFWLSRQLVVLMSLTVGRLADGVTYGDTIFSAILMGIMLSMGRAVCAALGGTIVTLGGIGSRPQRWAWVVALLYAVAARPRFGGNLTTTWDRVSQVANILWPAFVCILTAFLIALLRRDSSPSLTTDNKLSKTSS